MALSSSRVTALAVHAFTAAGAGAGLLAVAAAWEREFSACFAWLALALFVDGVDGTLARRARVKEHAAFIDGDTLDLVVDYLTYVVAPAVAFMRSGLVGGWAGAGLAVLIVTTSAIYFADKRMKTSDHWFRGFPALWNVAVFYLLVFQPPALAAAIFVILGAVAMFAPFVFVHPVRVVKWRGATIVMLLVWSASATLAIASDLTGSPAAKIGLAVTALYFLALPLVRDTPLADK